MPLIPNSSVVPPGGYRFVDVSTGTPVEIEGGSYDDLAKRILQHRLNNGRPPGDPYQEVVTSVCERHPHFCHPSEADVLQPRPAHVPEPLQGLANRCATWMARFLQTNRGDKGVPYATTQRRAEICEQCPKNQEFRGGCGSCVDNIQRLFFVWRRDRPLPFENRLFACDVTGQHNGAAALAENLPPLEPGHNVRLPSRCWRKET